MKNVERASYPVRGLPPTSFVLRPRFASRARLRGNLVFSRTSLMTAVMMTILAGACQAQNGQPRSVDGASWRMTAAGSQSNGIQPMSGSDGVTTVATQGGVKCLAEQPGATPPSLYLYFRVNDNRLGALTGPVYAIVDYFDSMPGGRVTLEYDSAAGNAVVDEYHPAEDQAGGYNMGAKKWTTAIFEMARPRFAHRENTGADFRLSGAPLFVRSARLVTHRPTTWDAVNKIEVMNVKPLVHIGPGGQLIVGGFDPAHFSDAVPQSRALEAAVPALKLLGVTSHEGYVRWNLCEIAPGKFDWSVYDKFVAVYKRNHLKWVPFLIIGSAYSLPDWYYKKPGSQGYVCLEHHQESDVQSLWNPVLRQHVARFVKAFCDHYRPTGVIESILLGVTGNYGEAIYPASGNDWTADIHGQYHTHPGYWAGDPFAVASFRGFVQRRYGTTAALSKAWGKNYASFQDVQPFLRQDAPNDRAWLDFTDWYIGSMTDYAHFWLTTTRANFPHGDIYLCTGGDAPPQHGSDFGQQCKMAAESHAGVRITNEGSDYRANFSLTRWVASGGEQYGAYYSFEPAGGVDPNGVIARIYNATASGARGLHYYFGNLYGSAAAERNFIRWGSQFKQRRPIVEIGVYYPETYIRLNGNKFLHYVQPLRDRFDFNYVSDNQIKDGGLKRVKALVMLEGNVAETHTWQAITDWVRNGGLLLYPDGMGRLRTVEGDESFNNILLAPGAPHGKGRVLIYHGDANSDGYRDFLSRALSAAPELSSNSRTMVAADGKDDNVFVTLCAPHELLWLNNSDAPVHTGPAHLLLPPHSIVSEQIGK